MTIGHKLRRVSMVSVLVAGLSAGVAGGVGVAGAVDMTEENSAKTESSAEGMDVSGSLNTAAEGSSSWTDFLAALTSKIKGFLPGPFVGSSGEGSSESILDFNKR